MLNFSVHVDSETNETILKTAIDGKNLLTIPQLNKGTAFTLEERHEFGLLGKLPHRIENLEDQTERAYQQLKNYNTPLQKNIYLNGLHDKNQILFYSLIRKHAAELIPIVYTPTISLAIQAFSREYRQARGLYISHTDQDLIEDILNNRSNPEIDLIVVTDGEGVLGIGDQGVGGMDIPVAKLMVYSICGGIDPTRTLPIFLDSGTNNIKLLEDPLYLGCQHVRIFQDAYDTFVEKFIDKVKKLFPHVFLHWEDFGKKNARRILEKYQDTLCSFNDDIQGTGVVTVAALLAASKVTQLELTKHRIVIFGAGSAGTGIGNQILDAMLRLGLSKQQALKQFWLVDQQGLLLADDATLTPGQRPFARNKSDIVKWTTHLKNQFSLEDVVREVKPTILIGCSAQPYRFTQNIIETMVSHCERPIIFPLSNPPEKCEAHPSDIMAWTDGKALVATGTLFDNVRYNDLTFTIAQCNNALVFPGIGLGMIAVKSKQLTDEMLWVAALELSRFAPSNEDFFLPLLPSIEQASSVSKHIAIAVARKAIDVGLARCNQKRDLAELIDSLYWEPRYLKYKKS